MPPTGVKSDNSIQETQGRTLKTELETLLLPHDQTHVLQFWDELDEKAQQNLADQIRAIDFEQLKTLAGSSGGASKWDELAAKAEVPPAITADDFANSESYQAAYEIGQAALKAGKVAMVLVAGGQGSRLGFEHPQGHVSHRSAQRSYVVQHADRSVAGSWQSGGQADSVLRHDQPTHARGNLTVSG